MVFQKGNEILERVNDILHKDTQVQSRRVDLTVNAVYELTGAGALDFGGSEFEPAPVDLVDTEKKHPDDDYGWWNLGQGTYLIEYNETLSPGDMALLLTPLQRLNQAGATHASQVITDDSEPVQILLEVGDGGCRLKENCRVTGVHIVTDTHAQ